MRYAAIGSDEINREEERTSLLTCDSSGRDPLGSLMRRCTLYVDLVVVVAVLRKVFCKKEH